MLESRVNIVADLERGSYPEETLPAELLRRSVCKERLCSPDSDSGDSERDPNGDERGLGSPKFDQHDSPSLLSTQSARLEVSIPRAFQGNVMLSNDQTVGLCGQMHLGACASG